LKVESRKKKQELTPRAQRTQSSQRRRKYETQRHMTGGERGTISWDWASAPSDGSSFRPCAPPPTPSSSERAEGAAPPPRVFLRKSAGTLENNGVDFWLNAKKCKRVRKSMKRQRLEFGSSRLEEKTGMHPLHPHPMHECQKKGDRKWAICKFMKRKSERNGGDWRVTSSRRSSRSR
jgi:hypothetical protein